MPEPKPWDRLPDESEAAYKAFLAYRDLGKKRSQDSAAKVLAESLGHTWSNRKRARGGRLVDWSSKFRWVERATAWDKHRDQLRDELLIRRFLKYERIRLKEIDEALVSAAMLRDKGRAMLKLPHVKRVVTHRDEQGREVSVTIEGARSDYLRAAKELIQAGAQMAAAALDGYRGDLPEGYEPDALEMLDSDDPQGDGATPTAPE